MSKYGHSSTPKGLSMVGEVICIELKDLKESRDMVREVCAEALSVRRGRE